MIGNILLSATSRPIPAVNKKMQLPVYYYSTVFSRTRLVHFGMDVCIYFMKKDIQVHISATLVNMLCNALTPLDAHLFLFQIDLTYQSKDKTSARTNALCSAFKSL